MRFLRQQQITTFSQFVVALLCLSLIGWTGSSLLSRPYDGVDWLPRTGIVSAVDPAGPAAGLLRPGDRIVLVDGAPPQQTPLYSSKRIGDPVTWLVQRETVETSVTAQLSRQPPGAVIQQLIPLLAASMFCVVSMVVLAYKSSARQSLLFLLFCQAFAAALATGSLSSSGPHWAITLFHILIWWTGPLSFHFHLYFPTYVASRFLHRVQVVLYAIAAAGSLPELISDPFTLRNRAPALFPLSLIWLTACLLGAIVLLALAFRRTDSREVRRQIGVVLIGGCTALTPFLTLLLLPYALARQSNALQEIAFLLLLAIPMTYGYAILHYQLFHLDRYVNRVAAYILSLSVFAALYLIVSNVLLRWIPPALIEQPGVAFLVALPAAGACGLLYKRLQRALNRFLYGHSYDYRSAVQLVSETLTETADQTALAQALCQSIQVAMQLVCVRMLLMDQERALEVVGLACEDVPPEECTFRLEPTSAIYQYFSADARPIESEGLYAALSNQPLSAQERRILRHDHALLWIPLLTSDELIGICILGAKRGNEPFNSADLDVLQVIIRLMNTAIQNTRLITELQQRAADIERLHQQIIYAREEERKRVARDLHDQIIQALVGMNYHLSGLGSALGKPATAQIAQLQSIVRQTLVELRRICSDLRPPALDSLGLIPALRSRLREFERRGAFQVTLEVEGDPEAELPEPIALCLYRVAQEALINVQKHAHASKVAVRLSIQPEQIYLTVQDNGNGFTAPRELSQLIHEQHFGFVGLREQLELVNGVLHVRSAIGRCTSIHAHVPLPSVLS